MLTSSQVIPEHILLRSLLPVPPDHTPASLPWLTLFSPPEMPSLPPSTQANCLHLFGIGQSNFHFLF